MRITVTDHALLRYIERVHKVDLEMIKAHIAKEVEIPAKVGASTVTIDGYVYCLVENIDGSVAVTTVLDSTMRARRHKRHHRKNYHSTGDSDD